TLRQTQFEAAKDRQAILRAQMFIVSSHRNSTLSLLHFNCDSAALEEGDHEDRRQGGRDGGGGEKLGHGVSGRRAM
ncbi:hypothetical protein, partial [Pseudooceanicola sp.]|uniref:hypothetical protein n=1 Tax=Pseudooceanicola sp. TaxID=1914328 RepID=UPI0035C6D10E